ncbi:MAG: GLPGLI family protein [Pedobacter sp.]|nr:MAG: GLPGLI family protein [Pedobacter sp.]
MKIKLLYVTALAFFGSSAFAQNKDYKMIGYTHSAQYKKSYKLDSLQKDYLNENFILLFNQDQSAFRSVSRFLLDSVKRTDEYNRLEQRDRIAVSMEYPSNNEELIYTNLDAKKITVTTFAAVHPAVDPSYEEWPLLKWTILDEYKTINNFDCRKAELDLYGRKWTAWFSLTHNAPFGPYKFSGLPGLIISISDATSSYKYELYKLKTESVRYPLQIHNNVKLVTKQEFKSIVDSGRYGMSLFKEAIMDNDQYKRVEKLKLDMKAKENNPIELIP